jgi:hypothetical protein
LQGHSEHKEKRSRTRVKNRYEGTPWLSPSGVFAYLTRMKMSLFFATGLLALSGIASRPAQAQGPVGGGPPQPITPTPAAVPLDGGASLLLASGVAYGLRHLRLRRQRA